MCDVKTEFVRSMSSYTTVSGGKRMLSRTYSRENDNKLDNDDCSPTYLKSQEEIESPFPCTLSLIQTWSDN